MRVLWHRGVAAAAAAALADAAWMEHAWKRRTVASPAAIQCWFQFYEGRYSSIPHSPEAS